MTSLDANHLLNLISRSYPGLIAYFDRDLNYRYVSDQYSEWFGVTKEEFLTKKAKDILSPEDVRKREPLFLRALKGESVSFELELTHLKLGQRIVEQIYYPDFDGAGEISGFLAIAYDVTEKKKAEQKLYSIFMQAPIHMSLLTGPDYVFEICNPSAIAAMNGKDLTGLPLSEALSPEQVKVFKPILDQVYFSKKSLNLKAVRVDIPQPDGTFREYYFDLYYEPWVGETGNIQGILNLGIDVTNEVLERKKSEANETLFRTYAETMPQMAFIADDQGKILYFNQRWYDYVGVNKEDYLKVSDDYYHPDDREDSQTKWKRCIEMGEPFETEYRLRRKDGAYRWFLGRALPLRDSEGRIFRWVGTDTDIQDQKEVERNQKQLVQLLDSSDDFVALVDLEGKTLFVNQAGRRFTGLGDQSCEAVRLEDFFFEEDREFVSQMIIPSTFQDGTWMGEFRLRNAKTGDEKRVHFHSFVIRNDKTSQVYSYGIIGRDLSEIKANELKLEQALKYRDEFLSIASHELKTPLTSLKLQSQMTLVALDHNDARYFRPDKIAKQARQTDALVSRLARLIDDMLDVSRIRNGRLYLHKKDEDIVLILKDVVSKLEALFALNGIDLPVIEGSSSVVGFWDHFRLEQVFSNLLTNAIKYGLNRPINVVVRSSPERVLIGIKDHGRGIPKADIERIFGRFERAINSSEVSGMGLGLFITKEIVEAHGGIIWVETELDRGSTFWVELPLNIE